ncbi:DUF998 domain-containing protein [Phaeobacter sp. B1627]|uniref:DUF998 domain-containing protein n=1 Tax=Phaeobacter sp. B1627 TaxID=2583809 RepID=UPI001117D622|nr:DUF998 domain-containing protein [Phaeobacter sp. B1627]TNJ42287.1 DUF998 domain-containing protein [Phaeobacter sp. B1627]
MKLNSSPSVQAAALFGFPVLSALWLGIGVAVTGALTPGYSHISQFMSALGASGAPVAAWANYAVFIPAELWLLAFLAVLSARQPRSRSRRFSILILAAFAVLLILAAVLPCDAGCRGEASGDPAAGSSVHLAHMVIAAVAYPLALIGLLPISLTASRSSLVRRLALPVTASGFCLYACIILFPEAQGLFQRLLEALIYAQIILLGRHEASAAAPIATAQP